MQTKHYAFSLIIVFVVALAANGCGVQEGTQGSSTTYTIEDPDGQEWGTLSVTQSNGTLSLTPNVSDFIAEIMDEIFFGEPGDIDAEVYQGDQAIGRIRLLVDYDENGEEVYIAPASGTFSLPQNFDARQLEIVVVDGDEILIGTVR